MDKKELKLYSEEWDEQRNKKYERQRQQIRHE